MIIKKRTNNKPTQQNKPQTNKPTTRKIDSKPHNNPELTDPSMVALTFSLNLQNIYWQTSPFFYFP